MVAQFKSLPQLFDFFKDDKTCIEYWEAIHWGGGEPVCPHCDNTGAYKTNRGYKCKNKECQKKFSALVGAIFENSKLPLRLWFAAIYLCGNHKKGISSLQLSRDLSISQSSAWYMLHRIRQTMQEVNPEVLGGEGVIVEADTTLVGGKAANMHTKKRLDCFVPARGGRANGNKTTIAGYVERGGTLRMEVIDGSETEIGMLEKHVCKTSALMTDSAGSNKRAGRSYAFHGMVDHSKDEYVSKKDRSVHTNTVEGAFSHFDRMVMGTYHFVSNKHMQAYANEYAYRYNTRKADVQWRFEAVVGRCGIDRVKYDSLTAKR